MTRKKIKEEEKYRQYIGIESGLMLANSMYISVNNYQMKFNRNIVELLVRYLIKQMKAESPTFSCLYVDIFGGGSGYEGLKITKPDEFDIDILMRIPKIAGPLLIENNIPGYVNLKLENFEMLKTKNLDLYTVMQSFVDEKNYLLTKEMKGSFMQSIFDRTMSKFPGNLFRIFGLYDFKITRVQSLGPAFTLTIEGPEWFNVKVDLVPCILLNKNQWPGEGFESNPYSSPSDFFIVPKSPKRDVPHIERYWRLSFQKQEREIIFDKQWLKPTIRVLKRVRDHFGHRVSSYAIKTMFLKELKLETPSFDETPKIWLSPLSYCVVHMLEVYAEYLSQGKIPYFWNKKMDLLEDLTPEQKSQYARDIEIMVQDIKTSPVPESILRFLR